MSTTFIDIVCHYIMVSGLKIAGWRRVEAYTFLKFISLRLLTRLEAEKGRYNSQ